MTTRRAMRTFRLLPSEMTLSKPELPTKRNTLHHIPVRGTVKANGGSFCWRLASLSSERSSQVLSVAPSLTTSPTVADNDNANVPTSIGANSHLPVGDRCLRLETCPLLSDASPSQPKPLH